MTILLSGGSKSGKSLFAQELTLRLANGGRRYYVQFTLDGLMRGDYKSRMEGYAIARQNGWMSANEIRELENLNPLSDEDGGNVYLVNGNMIPINVCGLTQVVKAVTAVDPAAGEQTQTDQPQEQKEDDSAGERFT